MIYKGYKEKIYSLVGGKTYGDIIKFINTNSRMYSYIKYKSLRIYNGKYVKNFNLEDIQNEGKTIKKLYELLFTINSNIGIASKKKHNNINYKQND